MNGVESLAWRSVLLFLVIFVVNVYSAITWTPNMLVAAFAALGYLIFFLTVALKERAERRKKSLDIRSQMM